jgi:hypothetical protein
MNQALVMGAIGVMVAVPVGGAAWMSVASDGQYYDVAPAQALSRISNAYLPTQVLGSTVKGSRVTLSGKDTAITSLIAADGTELMRFVTTVEADGTGSSVSTTIEPPTGPHAERAAAAMQSQAYTMGLMELLAQEHVEAAIEQRPFNMLAMNPAGDAMLKGMPGMKEHIDQANEAAAMMAEMEQDAFASADSGAELSVDSGFDGGDWGQ